MEGMMDGFCGMGGGMMGCGFWMLLWGLILIVLILLAVYGLVRLFQDRRARRCGPTDEPKP